MINLKNVYLSRDKTSGFKKPITCPEQQMYNSDNTDNAVQLSSD